MGELRVRELQPPPESDHFTFEEAMEAWRKVDADRRASGVRERRAGGLDPWAAIRECPEPRTRNAGR
jgi:hypothetical protein